MAKEGSGGSKARDSGNAALFWGLDKIDQQSIWDGCGT